jgi:hypothetical protein
MPGQWRTAIICVHHASNDARAPGWTRTYFYEGHNWLSRTTVRGREERYLYNARGCITSMPGLVRMD